MKSHASPNQRLFQIVVLDYKNRQPAPAYVLNSGNVFKKYHEIEDYIPKRTLFRWARTNKQAMKWARKFGTVIQCFKVSSHERRLHMIENLNVGEKPVYVDITPEDFTLGRNLEVSGKKRTIEIDIDKD